jgi:hypothetical protein
MKRALFFFALLAPLAIAAQDQSGPIVAQRAGASASANSVSLPANTEVGIRLNQDISTKSARQGETVSFSTTHDVLLDEFVVIPAGTRVVGEITWVSGKGMFGKSGKFELEVRYIDLGGRRIPLEGKFRQEGDGNTVATIGAVVVVPVAGFFVTGKSGVMPKGRELTVYTAQPIPVTLPAQ